MVGVMQWFNRHVTQKEIMSKSVLHYVLKIIVASITTCAQKEQSCRKGKILILHLAFSEIAINLILLCSVVVIPQPPCHTTRGVVKRHFTSKVS